jgi:hypothetical protein
VSYGVLFPFGAMGHPADDAANKYGYTDDSVSPANTANVKDAETAHVIQSRFVLAF